MTSRHSTTEIGSIVIPTCNRVDVLKRCLISYIENSRHYSRSNRFVVSDDSRSGETRAGYRQMLGGLSREYGVEIQYAGMEEKLRYARRLMQEQAAPPAVIKFALFDSEKLGLSTLGANRNALLLHTIGELILTVDDDTVCSLTPSPDLRSGMRIISHRHFSTYLFESTWVYPDRETLLKSIRFTSKDFLGIHESFLGRDLQDVVNLAGEESTIDLSLIDPRPTEKLEAARSRITATATGLVGDSTWPSPFVYFLLTGASRQRLTRSEEGYRAALLSREILRVTDRTTIADGTDATPGASFGLDNRELLPPFMPVAVAEDLVFWRTLLKCSGASYIAHLPWALLHMPMPPRHHQINDLVKGTSGIEFYILLQALMSSADQGHSCVEKGMKELGSYLQTVGSLPRRDFDELAHSSLLREAHLFISHLESILTSSGEAPDYWVADLKQVIQNMRESFRRQEVSVPLDLLRKRNLDEAREMTRRLVFKFGQLLCWWPEMVEAARKLKREGYRLALPVSFNAGAVQELSFT
jgi:hypothetical protein